MLDLINAARAANNRAPLRPNAQLALAAARHAEDLSLNPGLIDSGRFHYGSNGSTIEQRIAAAGYAAERYGEVTGWYSGAPVEWAAPWVRDYWMRSDSHRPLLLTEAMDEVGVGYAFRKGSSWEHVWVVNFGRRVGAPTPEPPPLVPPPGDHVAYVPVVVGGREVPPTGNAIDLLQVKLADPDCWRVVRHPGGNQEDVQDMELGGGLFVRRKGNLGEWHRYDESFFYLVHDTSPDAGTEGIPRVYTLYKNGKPGAPKSRRYQAVGEQWHEQGLHRVQFRARDDCRALAENSGDAQNHSVIERHERNYTFNRYGQGLTFEEVIWERTGVEVQIYGRMNGRSCGWIGWVAPWGSSEPVEVHWNRGRLAREPERVCGF